MSKTYIAPEKGCSFTLDLRPFEVNMICLNLTKVSSIRLVARLLQFIGSTGTGANFVRKLNRNMRYCALICNNNYIGRKLLFTCTQHSGCKRNNFVYTQLYKGPKKYLRGGAQQNI